MKVTITDNTANVKMDKKLKANLFIRYALDEVYDEARPVTPRKEGNLSRDVLRQTLGLKGKIVWRKIYAQYQEKGMRRGGGHVVKNYTTPGTGKHFARNSVLKVISKAPSIMKKAGLM